jgi:hypothetical protein
VGAVVQAAASGLTTAPFTATTDSLGRYRVSGVPSGQFVVGFYHDALTVLGLDAPTQGIELAADTLVTVNLAIPSSATVRAIRCGESSPFAPGMLVGSLRDAETHGTLTGAHVTLSWLALALEAGNYRTVTEQSTATIDDDGSFVACHVPLEAELNVSVTAPNHRTLEGPFVTVPSNGIAQLDLMLPDSTSDHGAAMIRGRVVRASGKTVSSGRFAMTALNREVPVQNGSFAVGDLPAGTWVAEARAIGAQPQPVLVTAADSAVTPTVITLTDHVQQLDAVTVVGVPNRNTLLLNDVLRRKRIGGATTFLPGSPALKSATFTTDVMKEARGFSYGGPTNISGRKSALGFNRRCGGVAVFVNDMRQADGFDGLDGTVPVENVLAIETYADINFAPVQYRGLGIGKLGAMGISSGSAGIDRIARRQNASNETTPCAVVLIWTKQ